MECEVSPENAKIINNILKTYDSNDIRIKICEEMTIQIVQDDKSLLTNINLKPSFFENYKVKKSMSFGTLKVPFYYKKMKKLRIKVTELLLCFIFEFIDHNLKKDVFISANDLYFIEFNPVKIININYSYFVELFRHFKSTKVSLEFKDKILEIYSKEKNNEVLISMDLDSNLNESIEMPYKNLKKIFSINEYFSSVSILFESKESPLNVVLENSEYLISFFAAVH